MKRARAAWRRLVNAFVPPALDPTLRRRAEIGLALTCVWIPLTLIRAILFLRSGPVEQAGVGLAACLFGCGLPFLLRSSGSLLVFGNAVAALWFAAMSSLTYMRGGIGSPALIGLGFVPLGATFVAGIRSGAAWTALVIVEVLAYLGIAHAGIHLEDHFPPQSRVGLQAVGAILSALAVFSIGVAYEGAAGAALSSLRRTEQKNRALLDALPDLVLRVDSHGAVLEKLGGLTTLPVPEDLLGRKLGDVMPDLWQAMREPLQRCLATNAVESLTVALGTGTDGRECEIRIRAAGREVLIVARDLTDVKLLAVKLSRAEEETRLLRADRMASVGQLASAVAHEANNPLAYVIANLAFVRDRLAELHAPEVVAIRPVLSEALADSLQGAERVRQIVRDLKTFARPDEGEARLIDLAHVLDLTVKMAAAEIRHRAALVKDYARAPLVLGNEGRLAQVFLNLVVNAAQSIPAGHADTNEIRVSLGTHEGQALVEIADTGHGIEPEHLARVTEPFFTTKPVGVGTGLGLTVSTNIVRAWGGDLSIDSVVGRGTTVRVLLPAAAGESLLAAGSDGPPLPESPTKLRVLAIDDDPLILKAIRRVLKSYELTTAHGGREGVAVLSSESMTFDVVLCDLMMPDLTGIEVYEHARRLGKNLEGRFVFLTGGAFTVEGQTFLRTVPNQRLDKPFSPDLLERALHRAAKG